MNRSFRKDTRKWLPLILWIMAVLLIEIFWFNAPSFHLIGGEYEPETLSLTSGGAPAESITVSGEEICLEWQNIDRRIGTVSLVGQWKGAGSVSLSADLSDDTNASYREGLVKATVSSADPRSHTTVVRLSGKARNLRLTLSTPENAQFTLSAVRLNTPVPFRFSPVRVGWLLVVGILVWLYLTSAVLRRPCSENKAAFDWSVVGVTAVCVLVAIGMTGLYMVSHSDGLLSEFALAEGDQITGELVDAFKNGQVHLLKNPSPELLAMENPYDWSMREEQGVSYLWDHCLYDGKYYSYYGIAPVLLLFLPYHLITGYYFSTILAVLLFGGVGIVFLSLTYRTFIHKFFPRLPVRLALFGLLTVQLSSGIWYCFCAMNFYEIAQAAGFCFVTMGAYFLLSGNVIGDGRISRVRVALATTCLSLAVLSRPTTAVYCVVALLFLFFGLKKQRKTEQKSPFSYLLSALLPFVLLGGVQMGYNYLRFDSFFDFGIQYSLTINDFTKAEFHPRFVTIGVYNYLLNPPVLSSQFPFVASAFDRLNPNGYYFVANTYAVGLLWRAIPVVGLLFSGKAVKKLEKEHRLPAVLLVGALSVVAPAIILFSIWESGYGVRYAVDFSWQMLIGAQSVLFYLYQKGENRGLRRVADLAALWSLVPTFITNFATVYAFMKDEVTSPAVVQLLTVFESLF